MLAAETLDPLNTWFRFVQQKNQELTQAEKPEVTVGYRNCCRHVSPPSWIFAEAGSVK